MNETVSVPCGTGITLASSPEKFELLEKLADDYNKKSKCSEGRVTVVSSASGDVFEGLTKGWRAEEQSNPTIPHVWSPASSSWVTMLPDKKHMPDGVHVVNDTEELPSIARTPVVLAMPATVAEKLGGPEGIRWSTLEKMAGDPDAWQEATDGEAGTFKLGKTNPNYSTTGLATLLHSYAAAAGTSLDELTVRHIQDASVRRRVAEVEKATLHYGETTLVYLCNLARADDKDKALDYVSVVPLEEKTVYDYNRGAATTGCPSDKDDRLENFKPKEPLVAVHPADGTMVSDAPYAILSTADEDQRKVAENFLKFIQSDDRQKTVKEHGFRDKDGLLAPDVAERIGVAESSKLKEWAPPKTEVIAEARKSWDAIRKPARILLVVDVSDSMNDYPHSQKDAKDEKHSRLGHVKRALTEALDEFNAWDEVGLWEFSGDIHSDESPYQELVRPRPVRKNKDALADAIDELKAKSATALYVTIRDAHRELSRSSSTDRITAIVVLSDGKEDYKNNYGIDRLMKDISAEGKENPVRVFTIAYSYEAPLETLSKMAKASGGHSYDSKSNPENISTVLREVVGNF
ncbi:substrate-binding domain-containing protein [Streptomyces taklimakanensis]|uniref:substrate-binding domain-containing protein n=1 Tax=Streptomyces taklimakanensis TaxID=2569853 RepID=UPI0013918AB7